LEHLKIRFSDFGFLTADGLFKVEKFNQNEVKYAKQSQIQKRQNDCKLGKYND